MSIIDRFKPRYSVLGLLMLTAILALAISHIQTTARLRATTSERDVAQTKLRALEVRDPNDISVISLPTNEPLEWRWRVHLPQGHSFRLRSAFAEIPATGVADKSDKYDHVFFDSYGVPLDTAEPFIFTLRLAKDNRGSWRVETQNPKRGMKKRIPTLPACYKWATGEHTTPDFIDWTQEIAGQDGAESATMSSPLVIVRYRKSEREELEAKFSSSTPSEGLMFWIERMDNR